MGEIKKIAVLTSGGDAPGMNSAIRAITRSALEKGIEVYGIYDGYRGLVENNIEKLDHYSVSNIAYFGGTILGSARLPEFANDDVAKVGADNLKKLGVDALVAIGGDGTYKGAEKLSKFGIKVVGVPGTIDNDIASTEVTIGFDSAVTTAVNALDAIRDTANSHGRCQILEVMGRYCPDISYAAGIASGCDIIINSDTGLDMDAIIKQVKYCKDNKHKHVLICVAEHMCDVHQLAKDIESQTGYVTRATVLGHTQRGGRPTAFDRILATRLGVAAVDAICNGQTNVCVGNKGNEIMVYSFAEAFSMKKNMFAKYAVSLNDSVR